MDYKPKNYELLKEIYDLLKSFPFNKTSRRDIKIMNIKSILKNYYPHSDMENNPVANAICWGASTLQSLFDKMPVRTLDEVLSFLEHILRKEHQEISN